MRFSCLAVVALAASVDAYVTPHYALGTNSRGSPARSGAVQMVAAATAETTDVSIPYDAAAELEYSEWISKYGKPYDEKRYQVFKSNYKAITVMNVSAKKQARDSGSNEAPSLLTLNEFADFTAEEYEAAMNGESTGASDSSSETGTGDILGDAVAAIESQSAASSALQDAADALAEEEEKLAAQLGLDSVEELELAIDQMEGISEEGTVMESDNLAREARVRSAYMEWCKEYSKEQDESRFPQFYSNFLEMEEFAKESGKEMVLNEYADYTEEEYAKLTSDKEEKEAVAAKAKADEAAAAEAAAEQEAAAKAKAKADQEAAARKEAEAKKKAEEEEKQKARAEAVRLSSMSEEERRQEIEKEKSARQSAQAKELEKAAQASEAAAIAAATAAAKAEAEATAKRRQIEEEAFELARAKARDWDEKQAKLVASRQPSVQQQKKKPASSFGVIGDLASKVAPPAKKEPAQPKTETPAIMKMFDTPVKKESPKKESPMDGLASFFESPAPAKKAAPKKTTPPPAPKPAAKAAPSKLKQTSAPRPTLNLASIFESKPATPAPKQQFVAPAPTPAPKKASAPRPTLNLGALFESKPAAKKAASPAAPAPQLNLKPAPKIDTKDPVTDAFSSLFGGSKKSPAPKADPSAAPAPAAKKSTGGFFGGLSSPAPKKAAPAPAPAPAAKKTPAPSFSFFNSPAPKKAPAPAAAPKKAPAPSFSFFNKPEPKKAAAPAPVPVPKKRASFSLFNAPKPAASKPAAVAKSAPKVKPTPSRPTLSLFAPKAAAKPATAPVSKPAPKRPTLAIFGNSSPTKSLPKKVAPAKKAAVTDTIPVLSKWTQNDDGSITGLVSNSKSFRNGTRITTSPVRKGAKMGTTVKTGSGSQYRLN